MVSPSPSPYYYVPLPPETGSDGPPSPPLQAPTISVWGQSFPPWFLLQGEKQVLLSSRQYLLYQSLFPSPLQAPKQSLSPSSLQAPHQSFPPWFLLQGEKQVLSPSPQQSLSPSPLQAPQQSLSPSPLQAPQQSLSPGHTIQAPQPVGKSSVSAPPLQAPTALSKNNAKLAAGLGVGIGIAVLLIIGVAIFMFCYKRKRHHALPASFLTRLQSEQGQQDASPLTRDTIAMLERPGSVGPSSGSILGYSKTIFSYKELAKAASDFSEANFLGQGGFGIVFKGVLPNGGEVAIKQLKVGSDQGEREFQAEIDIISRVHHRHLVSLAGYCISRTPRLLVYEFVPNKSLKFHLHGHPKIIHRDIKSANILLDHSFEAKVADFGLARFNSDTRTHITTRVMGTFGYLAPEYALTGKLTDKSDVFSFGVVLLELITGRRPIGEAQFITDDNIVDWARPLLTKALEDNTFDTLADPRLQKDYDSSEMARMVTCAATCVRHLARRRPRMGQIVRALEGNMSLDDLSEGIRPGHSTVYYTSHENLDYGKAQYKEDMKKFRKMALGDSQGHGASEGSTGSDLGLNPSATGSEGLQTTQEMSSGSEIQQTTPGGNGN